MARENSFIKAEERYFGGYSKTVLDTLYQSYRPQALGLMVFLLFGLTGRTLLLANANIVGFWVDSLCTDPTKCKPVPHFFANSTTDDFILYIVLASTCGFLSTLAFRLGLSRLSAGAVSRLYDEVTLRTSRLPMDFFDRTPAGRVITRFSSDYSQVFRMFGGPLAEFLSLMFDLVAIILLSAAANFRFIFVILIVGVAYYLVYRINRTRLRIARRNLSRTRSPSIAHFAETAQGASTIRAYQKEKMFLDRFSVLNQEYLGQRIDTAKCFRDFQFQMHFVTALVLIGLGMASIYFVKNQLISLGAVSIAFAFILISGTTVQMFFDWVTQFEDALVGVERMDNYLRRPLESGAFLPSRACFETNHFFEKTEKSKADTKISGNLKFEKVWFRYGADLPWILKDVSFDVRSGEKIGIAGRTGSGKSSIIQALFNIYPVEKGSVTIDGYRARVGPEFLKDNELDLATYRKQIGLISQDPAVFRGTLLENLDPDESKSHDYILGLLRELSLGDWLDSHKKGLDFKVEEKGRNLSSGEKQIICLARCIIQDAPIIVMDEATSFVDPQTEVIISNSLDKYFKNKTRILIAHRISTIENCDRIILVSDGQIQKIGKPREVLS